MIEIANHYVDEICWIAQMNSYYASIQDCREIARDFVKGLEIETDTVKHGGWFLLDECSNAGVYCSVCYKKVYKTDYANQKVKSKYCPNCGAIMDLEGEK